MLLTVTIHHSIYKGLKCCEYEGRTVCIDLRYREREGERLEIYTGDITPVTVSLNQVYNTFQILYL
jgi:hypothetical protein